MTCLDVLLSDIDTIIDCKVDCIGCKKTDCPDDKRKRGEGDGYSNKQIARMGLH